MRICCWLMDAYLSPINYKLGLVASAAGGLWAINEDAIHDESEGVFHMLYALQILTINYSDRGDGTYPIYSTSNGRNSGRLGGERIEQLLRRVVQQYRKSAVGCEYYVKLFMCLHLLQWKSNNNLKALLVPPSAAVHVTNVPVWSGNIYE